MQIILGSASPRRRELMAILGLPFEVEASGFEEPAPETHPNPGSFARELALAKASEIARRRPGTLVIGADTLVVLGDLLLAKPADDTDAARMLALLSGVTHQVITGVALVTAGCEPECLHAVTDVTFRRLGPEEIRAYVATGEPADKAGAYAIQGQGALLIERISGDYPNVVGLPIAALARALRRRGYSILGS